MTTVISKQHRMRRLLAIVLLTALVATLALAAFVSRAGSGDPATANQKRSEDFAKGSASLEPTVTALADGKSWSVGRFVNSLGEVCLKISSPQGWSAGNCLNAEKPPPSGLAYSLGGTPDITYVYGAAGGDVGGVELVFDDCSREDVSMNNHVFLAVLDTSAADRSPYKLHALDRNGAVLATTRLEGLKAGDSSKC